LAATLYCKGVEPLSTTIKNTRASIRDFIWRSRTDQTYAVTVVLDENLVPIHVSQEISPRLKQPARYEIRRQIQENIPGSSDTRTRILDVAKLARGRFLVLYCAGPDTGNNEVFANILHCPAIAVSPEISETQN